MKSYRKELWFNLPERMEMVNITPDVEECLNESGISDTPATKLPPESATWIDDRGALRASRVARTLVRHPLRMFGMLQLQRHGGAAMRGVAAAIESYLAAST